MLYVEIEPLKIPLQLPSNLPKQALALTCVSNMRLLDKIESRIFYLIIINDLTFTLSPRQATISMYRVMQLQFSSLAF